MLSCGCACHAPAFLSASFTFVSAVLAVIRLVLPALSATSVADFSAKSAELLHEV